MTKNSSGNFNLAIIKKNLQLWLQIVMTILLLILLVLFVWYIVSNKKQQLTAKPLPDQKIEAIVKNNLDLSSNDPQVGGMVEKVSRHILLPSKQLTVATVSDASSLWKQNPILFQYIRNGQTVILYDTGMIVYDAEIDKVVDIVQFYDIRKEKLIKTGGIITTSTDKVIN